MLTMNVDKPTVGGGLANDGYNTILKEAYSYFKENGINMVGDFQDILTEDTFFKKFTGFLSQDMSADESKQVEQLCENARLGILQESVVNQISPLAGLSMPTVRKMWTKVAMKNAIPTETAKVPSFQISWMEPYLTDADGVKHALPDALKAGSAKVGGLKKLATTKYNVGDAVNLLTENSAQEVLGDAIITKLYISEYTITVPNDVSTEDKVVPCRIQFDLNTGTISEAVETLSAHADDANKVAVTDQLFGKVNWKTGEVTTTALGGLITKIVFDGALSQENNTRTSSVSFDIDKKQIDIPVGEHINAPLPIEWLTDTMAMYNIDGTVECVDLMSGVTAQNLDVEIIEKLIGSFDELDAETKASFLSEFDVKPTAGFSGSPTEWRKEIRTTIDHLAIRLKSKYNRTNGYFVIFGNPIDVNLIPNVQWSIKAATGTHNNVSIDYDFGVVTSSNTFKVVSTDNIVDGKLYVFFVPSTDKFMTYKYYPYMFNVERGTYSDPVKGNVPNIMMTKRHTIEELVPIIGAITVQNNTGSTTSQYAS